MTHISSIDDLPPELLMEVLSHLSWRQQLGVRRVTSGWRAAVDACLGRRQELYISREDRHTGLNTERLLNLLESMPALRRLVVDRTYDVDMVLPVGRLCTSCPQLQVLGLGCQMDDAGLETLLRHLPNLYSLYLTNSEVKGDCLPLLPTGMQSLSPNFSKLKSANLRHLTRCTQLRELDLSFNEVHSDDLAAVLAACPQLERLAVAHCRHLTWGWLSELKRCPQLRELNVSGRPTTLDRDLFGVLTAFSRLERLWIRNMSHPLSAFPNIILPRLTHLDLTGSSTDDDTFRRLPDLLPSLRYLRLDLCRELTNDGLARVLPRLSSLQVLDMKDQNRFKTSTETLISLSGLPLKALACNYPGGKAVSVVLRRCPSLTVLQLTDVRPKLAKQMAADLVKHPLPTDRDVTLIVEREPFKIMEPAVPKNIRLKSRGGGHWENACWLICGVGKRLPG